MTKMISRLMSIVRTRLVVVASILLIVGLALPLGALYVVGHAQAVRDAQGKRATDVATRLEALRAVESRRPWYQYQRLYHEPRSIDNGASLLPSPLRTEPRDPLVTSWFSIDKDGQFTSPSEDDDKKLSAIVAANRALFQVANPSDTVIAPPEAQVLAQGAYFQNTNPQVIYTDLTKGGDVNANAFARGEVVVRAFAMRWGVVDIDGVPELVCVRAVRTPDGSLTQGFIVRRDMLGDDVRVLHGPAPEGGGYAVPIAFGGGPGVVSIDASSTSLSAFHKQFFAIFAIASLAGLCVVLVVARSERLASERARFAAVAAHELRTPLAGLRLHAEMLAEDLGDPESAHVYARRIADESARLSRVVSNVLGFTRLERGALDVHVKRGDLAPVVREEVVRMKTAALALEAELVVDAIEDDVPCLFDSDAVVQILQNLIDNAEKYSRGAADRRIHLSLTSREADGVVVLAVEDRGPGVDASLGRSLFRPFARGASTDAPAGVGLGLSIGRALARAQGGDLTHAARSGGGSVFTLTLPRAASTHE